jgi:hypothetical protein
MGIYIPLPYCHIDMILENAWFSNFQKDLEYSIGKTFKLGVAGIKH